MIRQKLCEYDVHTHVYIYIHCKDRIYENSVPLQRCQQEQDHLPTKEFSLEDLLYVFGSNIVQMVLLLLPTSWGDWDYFQLIGSTANKLVPDQPMQHQKSRVKFGYVWES